MAHTPVLLTELLNGLALNACCVYVDATFGGGGVTRALLETVDAHIVTLDRDPEAVAKAYRLSQAYPGRLTVLHGRFSRLGTLLRQRSLPAIHGIIFDLGVSSVQLESARRGFSFRLNGPLDMRMDQLGPSAKDFVNTLSRVGYYSDPQRLRSRTQRRSNRTGYPDRPPSSPRLPIPTT